MDRARAQVRPDWTDLVAGTVALGMDVVYVALIRGQDDGALDTRVQLIAASLAVAGTLALGAWALPGARLRLALLSLASFTLLAWGFLGMFSIGVPVFIAGILLLFSVGRATDEVEPVEAWTLTALGGIAAILAAAAVVATT